jgi:hypothetical protein
MDEGTSADYADYTDQAASIGKQPKIDLNSSYFLICVIWRMFVPGWCDMTRDWLDG